MNISHMKNHLKFIIIALCIIVISLFNSCRHEAVFPYTQKGLNRASYMVDGKAYKIDNVSLSDMGFSYISKDSNLYGFCLFPHSNEGVYFGLNDIKFQLGRINFKIPRTSASYIDANGNQYAPLSGYVDIKYIDSTNKYKRIIAGEFELTAKNGKINKTVNITHGNFDTQYVIYP